MLSTKNPKLHPLPCRQPLAFAWGRWQLNFSSLFSSSSSSSSSSRSFPSYPAPVMAPFFVLNLGIDTPFSEGVDGAPSMGLLSFPTPAVALFPSKERWSNPPSTGGVDGVLSQGYLPMAHGLVSIQNGAFRCPLCVWYRLKARNVAFGICVVSFDLKIWHFFPNIVTTMCSSRAPCDRVFTNSAAFAADEDLFRIFRLFCVVTFGPLQLGLSFWTSIIVRNLLQLLSHTFLPPSKETGSELMSTIRVNSKVLL
ncbi:hypothetical protein DVH24_026250 [Malus domestica]|uniref:Uncharacterized protein n=1 Tax=Malus domestica TaxID=3750 RepID=A0A498KL04_MALDO|nr:hypothetical protein DVH24_026250 [Malus domestica]